MPICVLETLNSACVVVVRSQLSGEVKNSGQLCMMWNWSLNYHEPPPNAVEDRYWWEKSVWLVNWRPWSWGCRQFEVELQSLHFMLTRNSQKEVVVRTLLNEALNSNFLLMWEQCLDKGMVPVWDQLVLQAGALQGNSHLAGEAGWTQLNRLSRMH